MSFENGGRSKEQAEALVRLYGNLPIEDAIANLLITVAEPDKIGAVMRDPENCVLAKTCKRLFGSSKVVFFKRFSYVDLPNEEGTRTIYRFENTTKIQAALVRYEDKSGDGGFDAGTYILKAPSPANRLDRSLKYSRDRRAKPGEKKKRALRQKHRKARIKAVIKATGKSPVKTINKAGPEGVIRNGSGLVFFSSNGSTDYREL
jgi:hypothetical protein